MFALLNPAKRTHKLNFFRNVSGYVASYRVRGMHAFSNGKLMAIDFYRCTVKRCILSLHLDCTDNRESVGGALIKIKVSTVLYFMSNSRWSGLIANKGPTNFKFHCENLSACLAVEQIWISYDSGPRRCGYDRWSYWIGESQIPALLRSRIRTWGAATKGTIWISRRIQPTRRYTMD